MKSEARKGAIEMNDKPLSAEDVDLLGELPESEQTCKRCGQDRHSLARWCYYCETGEKSLGSKFRESGESMRLRASALLETQAAEIAALKARIVEFKAEVEKQRSSVPVAAIETGNKLYCAVIKAEGQRDAEQIMRKKAEARVAELESTLLSFPNIV